MYSKRRDPLGCQMIGYRITGVLAIVIIVVWIIGRALEWVAGL